MCAQPLTINVVAWLEHGKTARHWLSVCTPRVNRTRPVAGSFRKNKITYKRKLLERPKQRNIQRKNNNNSNVARRAVADISLF